MFFQVKIPNLYTQKLFFAATACATPLLLGGCSGGGSDSQPSAPSLPERSAPSVPAPVPTPPSNPTQIAPISSFETEEYFDAVGLNLIGAASAYSYGATGKGISVAVIDTLASADHQELFGQLSPLSTDLFGADRAADDFDHTGHGTAVAAIIAGNRDGEGIHGVAYEAEILAIRADRAGSCVNNGIAGPCAFRDTHVAQGIDYAIENGADIINLSVGGAITADQTSEDAIRRATQAGILIVLSAGNDGRGAYTDDYGYDHAAQGHAPNEPAYLAGMASSLGLVVAVGSVDENGRISDFSNRAGDESKTFYLLAPGESIISAGPDDDIVQPGANGNDTDNDGDYYRIDGTSFAAPYVAGSLALLLQSFPNLNGAEALQILLETADDYINPDPDLVTGEAAGVGIDNIGGAGIVNLAEAFKPQGQRTAQINGKPIALASLSAPAQGAFGDWAYKSGALEGQVFTDKYNRAFSLVARGLSPKADAPLANLDAQRDWFNGRSETVGIGSTELRFSTTERTQMPWEYTPVEDDIQLSARFTLQGQEIAFGRGGSATRLAPAASLSTSQQSLLTAAGNWTQITRPLGQFDVQTFAAKNNANTLLGTAIGQNSGKLNWRAAFAQRTESGTALGSQLQSRFGAGEDRSTAYTLGFEGRHDLGKNWVISAGAELSAVGLDGLDAQDVVASQFSVGISRHISGFGNLRASLVQPTRIETGTLSFTSATGMDSQGNLVINTIEAGLSPSGRELNFEMGLDFNIGDKWHGNFTALHIDTPNNVAGADSGGAVQLNIKRVW